MIFEALTALQNLEPVAALRASRWVYPLVNTAHITGLAVLFGAILPLDLRLLGLCRASATAREVQGAVRSARVRRRVHAGAQLVA